MDQSINAKEVYFVSENKDENENGQSDKEQNVRSTAIESEVNESTKVSKAA